MFLAYLLASTLYCMMRNRAAILLLDGVAWVSLLCCVWSQLQGSFAEYLQSHVSSEVGTLGILAKKPLDLVSSILLLAQTS